MVIISQAHLAYKDSRSDKEYHLELQRDSSGSTVICKFGPRGGTLTHVNKTKGATTYAEALRMYKKTLEEKLNKGYIPIQTHQDKLINRIQSEVGIFRFALSAKQWQDLADFVIGYAEECA